jgi:hypothetical protein
MIQGIRLATQEEATGIVKVADLTPQSQIWVWPNEKGESDIGVLRRCLELDPVIFGETSGNQRKALFYWALLNMLRATGNTEVYFSIDADSPQEYIDILKKMGGEQTTEKPQLRFKVVL